MYSPEKKCICYTQENIKLGL